MNHNNIIPRAGTHPGRLSVIFISISLGLLTGCSPMGHTPASRSDLPSSSTLRKACPALAGTRIDASEIGLPSGAAAITEATLRSATAGSSALPEYCQVLGRIAPRDPAAPPITFQLNLPLEWNGRTLQYGGGGFNGKLETALGPVRNAPQDTPVPLARGYVTLGTDSGHRTTSARAPTEVAEFALNDEAFENFAYGAYKKVGDVAGVLVKRFYHRAPDYRYYYGGSEGGREGLTMAQRFPNDYDGIVSVVPVIGWTGLFHGFQRHAVALRRGGWMNDAEVETLGQGVIAACDSLDGLRDGVVRNFMACQARFKPSDLQCKSNNEATRRDDCLSTAQVNLVETLGQRYTFDFPLANGLSSYPGWLYGAEDVPGSFGQWVTGPMPPTHPVSADPGNTSRQYLYGDNFIRYVITRDPAFDLMNYRADDYAARVREVSQLMDSTDPDLSRFFAHGGKLIMREETGDYAQSPMAGIQYFQSVMKALGSKVVDHSARLYLSTATTHDGSGQSMTDRRTLPTSHDMLSTLDHWVAGNETPADVLTLSSKDNPYGQGTQLMCRYPDYPHYVGGDRLVATSYECRASR
ncbi:tannase/feruloyl esterase family alpha/beta hydrolase [Kushneria phyllosphaerae]|uniref:Mono(2-hydroxyethyl) terephthalate hydrolase n=1 Tax=Kushneria phyllosphaerae TaxID=2100822 RepID=A0A2R8CH46_9GAMM|nr:tannase/feruloyl esterase family alpha/beta hydrolase [Kushneria phyllosphaerae]SPJ32211.1 Mono(2-hydroxyethyl) terephthalate hydrolase [Kushneria phyllosphaerae]